MNLVLTPACTNSCPYCFEKAEQANGKQNIVSDENIIKFTKWAHDSGLQYLSLLGGEPFLHPKLADIVKTIRRHCPWIFLRILTGGIFNPDLLNRLSPEEVSIGFNINEPRDYLNPKHFAKVVRNVETAIKKGFKVTLSFNVWRPDFDTTFMPKLADSLARTSFSWTVANPIRGFPNKVVPPSGFDALSDKCFLMLQEAARLNIETLLDCPLPLCFFKESQLAWIRQYQPATSSVMGCCEPALDVTPDLQVLRCFALSNLPRVKISDFHNEMELKAWFQKNIDQPLLDSGCFASCIECEHHKSGRCSGGCLANHQLRGEVAGLNTPPDLELQMNIAIESGNPEEALSLYRSSNFWSKTDRVTLKAAEAQMKLGHSNEAFRLASLALDKTNDLLFLKKTGGFLAQFPNWNCSQEPEASREPAAPNYIKNPNRNDQKAVDPIPTS